MKKVLVVSYLTLMDTTPNGRIMKSLLQSELAWKFGHWHEKRFQNWLKEQNPDCVVCSCENYYFKHYNHLDHKNHSLPFAIYHRMFQKATMKRVLNTVTASWQEAEA